MYSDTVGEFHLANAVKQHLQAPGQVAQGQLRGADGATGHVGELVAVHVYHAKTGGLQAGVDAKDSHVLLK